MREVIEGVLAGVSLGAAARSLNSQGMLTTRGGQWQGRTLRQYLTNPRLVGWRVYRGQLHLGTDGKPVQGTWEPLVTIEEWERLQAVLTRDDNRARKPRRDARYYLLTGLVRCGLCNGMVYGHARRKFKDHTYTCQKGHLSVSGRGLDGLISTLILRKMQEDLQTPLSEAQNGDLTAFGGGGGVFPYQEELEALESAITSVLGQLGKPGIKPGRIYAQAERMESELATLEQKKKEWLATHTGPARKALTPDEWHALSMDKRRGFVENYLSAIYVRPPTRHSNAFDPERIVPVWHGQEG